MLIAARADVTQYTIWHRSHTAPVAVTGNPAIEPLLFTDIEALCEYVDDLCFVYWRLEKQAELSAVLERLRFNIADPRWQRRITCFQAAALHIGGDQHAAEVEFAKLGPITRDEKDVHILRLYLDLHRTLPFAQKVAACDQILANCYAVGDTLQYSVLKAFNFAAIGDFSHAADILSEAANAGRKEEKAIGLGPREKQLLAGILTYLGLFTKKPEIFDEAITLYDEIIAKEDVWTPEGRTMLLEHQGECFRYAGKWKEAEACYRAALVSHPSEIAKVFLADCLAQQDKLGEATRIFDEARTDTLNPEEKMDHAYTAAMLAAETEDTDRIKSAIILLKSQRTSAPFFDQRRLDLIVQLQDLLANGKPSAVLAKIKKLLRQPLRTLSRYAVIQPNIIGIGLNLNAIIDDMTANKKDKDNASS